MPRKYRVALQRCRRARALANPVDKNRRNVIEAVVYHRGFREVSQLGALPGILRKGFVSYLVINPTHSRNLFGRLPGQMSLL